MNNVKKTLLASGMTIALTMALLVGTTFALFTGRVENNNNKITAGILKMGAYAYDALESPAEGGTTVSIGNETYSFNSAGQDLRVDKKASIGTNFDPAKTYVKLYEVKNEGTINFKCKFDFFNCFDGGLGDKLWFDFVPLKDDNTAERGLDKTRDLAGIGTWLDNDAEGTAIKKGESKRYLFVCGLKDDQSSDYFKENCSGYEFTFDIEIKAAQLNGEFQTIPKEETLCGDISDAAGIDTMMRYIENGNNVEANVTGNVQLDNVMTLKTGQILKLNIEENAVFEIPNQIKDKSGFENSKNNNPYTKKAAIIVQNGAELEITGKGRLQCDDYYTIKVEKGGSLHINDTEIKASNGYKDGIYGIFSEGNVTLEGVTMEVSTDNDIKSSAENPSPQGGSTAYGVYAAGGTLTVKDSMIHVVGATNGNTGNGANGIYINGAQDVTVTGTTITGTGEGSSQCGIFCFGGSVRLLSNVNIDMKGTAVDTRVPIEKIESSTLTGTEYSLYNRSNTAIEATDTTLEGAIAGEVVQSGAANPLEAVNQSEENNPEGESAPTEGGNPEGESAPTEGGNPEGENAPTEGGNPEGENALTEGGNPEGKNTPTEGSNPEGKNTPTEGSNPEGENAPSEENNLKGEDKAAEENISAEQGKYSP